MTDTIVEGDEIFTVVLESPDDVNLMPDMGTVTINDTSGTRLICSPSSYLLSPFYLIIRFLCLSLFLYYIIILYSVFPLFLGFPSLSYHIPSLSYLFLKLCCHHWCSVLAVVTPEFDQPSYTVPEDDGPVEVCLVVPVGQIERETVVQLLTMPGTATSEALFGMKNCCRMLHYIILHQVEWTMMRGRIQWHSQWDQPASV